MKTNCYIEKSNNRAYLANWSVPCQVLQVLNVFFFLSVHFSLEDHSFCRIESSQLGSGELFWNRRKEFQ